MLTVTYAEHYMKALYAECRYAESSGAPLMYSWKLGPGFVLLDYNFLDSTFTDTFKIGGLGWKN
jgi:hypothetical protein